MKLLLLTFFTIILYIQSFGQPRDAYYLWPYGVNNKIQFTESVYLPEGAADSLYSTAQIFLKKRFHSDSDSIVSTDYNRTVSCNGSFYIPVEELGERGKGFVGFKLTIMCRNKYYRYTFDHFHHFSFNPDGASGGDLENDRAACGGAAFPLRYWSQEKAKAYYYIQVTIENLKESMRKKRQ